MSITKLNFIMLRHITNLPNSFLFNQIFGRILGPNFKNNLYELWRKPLVLRSRTARLTYINFKKYVQTSSGFIVPGSLALIVAQTAARNMTDEQNIDNVLQNADQLFDENHFQEVFDVLSKYSDQSLSEIKWRKARALFSISKTAKDKTERAMQIRDAFDLIKSAVEADAKNFAAHKWMAIILDAHAELDGVKSRITQLENVKYHMKKAVELNPEDPTSWHILGSFEFGLAELPWIQRKIVSTIFASPPTGTYEQALECFEKAEKLKEGFYSLNWLMLGKCHLVLKNKDKAKAFLEKAANCQVLNEDDKNCKEEACALLKKF